ncbi:HipA family kinase [Pseudoalteromonas ruthenica]|uniref:HipA family kinase n=1 Tax=Pseudoalteromonas ruthenica TaxID=151081 RepID=UPI0014867299|nr:HipA family kinase [Pseudoalteromonas ruthenica]
MILIEEITRQMKQGQTAPFLCTADDGNQYIVKGARATSKGLVKEWISAHLCRAFGLPIPDFELAYVDDALVEYGYDDLGSGMCFASQFVPNIQDIPYAKLGGVSQKTLRDLYLFDFWIKNDDRCLTELGGNPNLFLDPVSNELIVLDHNLAFDSSFNLENHTSLHVGRAAWFATQFELFGQTEYEEQLENAFEHLAEAVDSIPDEWLESYSLDSIKQEIIVVLEQFRTTNFWEALR